eukprot:TRINITY_DN62_c0_g2_i1.p1 TRINITY_DN62_c0_g2~~TRINITY_DN62_c0_g2_i1.p1  ORF type:complete len:253 (-),score=30.17 TRINITY_DN62_c0_g2_i1:227-937(-)
MVSKNVFLIPFWVLASFHVFLRVLDGASIFKPPFLLHIISKCVPIIILVAMSSVSKFKAKRVAVRTLLTLGLVFSACGDFAIAKSTAAGIVCFGLAHIMYVACFIQKTSNICIKGLIIAFCLFLFIGIWNFEAAPSPLKYFVIGYCALISTMFWRGVSVSVEGNTSDHSSLTWIGCSIFLVSDFVLSVLLFHKRFIFGDAIVMTTYYVGQFLITWAMSPRDQGSNSSGFNEPLVAK